LLHDNTVRDLTDRFYRELQVLFGNRIRLNGHPENRLPNTLYISFLGYQSDAVHKALAHVAISTGSACHSGSTTISPVLKAMGVASAEVGTVIRFSLGRFTTQNEIDIVLDNLSDLVNRSNDYSI
jgi:cysteine desulfurase